MFELTVEIQFSAAHRIEGHPGPCAHLHGHNYHVAVTVAGDQLGNQGMLLDFGRLKDICREVIDPLDHSFLNDLPPFSSTNPSAEALAQHIFRGVAANLPSDTGIRLARVTVRESDTSAATYSE